MNMKQLNRVCNALDSAADKFLGGALFPILTALTLIAFIIGVSK